MLEKSSRLKARAERVAKACDLGELLQTYGYNVVPDAYREQQFSCDLHGPDKKPSARFYPATNSTYCWACQKSRDPIAWTMEKEGLGYAQAIGLLEERLGLGPLPWNEGESQATTERNNDREEKELRRALRGLAKTLQNVTDEREVPQTKLLMFWEALDRISYGLSRQGWTENQGFAALARLREHVMLELKKDC